MNILALDLGKFNTMCCFFDSKTRKHQFLNAATERNYLTTVLKSQKIDLVVMKACGPSGWVSDLAQSLGHKTLVCSTNEDARRWSGETVAATAPRGFCLPGRTLRRAALARLPRTAGGPALTVVW